MKQKPEKELRDGQIKATIWKNASKKADSTPFYSIQFSRIYKVEDQWNETTSFGREDLLKVQNLANIAYRYVSSLKAATAAESAPAPKTTNA